MGYVDKENQHQYSQSAKFTKPRLDLNDLLKRAKDKKKSEKKGNLLILSGSVAVAFVVILLLSL